MGKLRGIPLSCLGPKALAQLRAQGINPDAVGKGPKTFAGNLPTEQSKEKYHRSAAAARTHDGEVFDSKLELAAHRWLTEHGVQFERQVEIELQPGFEFEGKKIRKISYFADFKISKGLAPQNAGENWGGISEQTKEQSREHLWVDMKGFETAKFKLQWKLLLFKGIYVHKVRSVTDLVSLLQKLDFWQNQR